MMNYQHGSKHNIYFTAIVSLVKISKVSNIQDHNKFSWAIKAGKCKVDQAFITRVHVIFRSYHIIMYVGYK